MTAQAGGGGVGAPLRSGKKMRKRRELDALVGYASGGRRAAPLLIAGSSDDRDEPAPPPWLARRGRRPTRGPCAPAARACAALLLCACATATATVVWLFIDVREQITSLRSEMELVSMGSQSVGDALQRCHSAAKELLHNHTEMAARLDQLVLRTDNLTAEVKVLNSGLSEVTQQVAGAPELVTVPLQLKDLQTNVARFGSQLKDMDATVGALKTQANAQDDCKKNITVLESQVSQLWNRSLGVEQQHSSLQELGPLRKQQADLQASFLQLSSNVSQVNSTLTSMISWATQDYDKDHHKVVGLMESVQNNSAALSSLQTAWRQGNDVLAKNISDLSNEIADKSAEFQRQFLELKQLQQQLAAAQAQLSGQGSAPPGPSPSAPAPGGFSPPLPSSPEAPADPAAPVPSPGMVQSSGSNDTPKKMTNAPTPFPGITQAPIPIMRAATGKPSILSSGSA